MDTLITVLHYGGYEASEWLQIYQQDPDFTTTYQMLCTSGNVIDFQIQDELLCHLGHLYVPTRKRAKLIWDSHYSHMERHFGMDKTMVSL
jgi:hypothetical protein